MNVGRLSPRARARLASLAGVLVACALIAGSLVSLNRTVLPFKGWPTIKAQGPADSILPAVPDRGSASARRGERAGGVRLADGRVVALPLPGVTAGPGAGGAAALATTPASRVSPPPCPAPRARPAAAAPTARPA